MGLPRGWFPGCWATRTLRGQRAEDQEHRYQPCSLVHWAAWVSSSAGFPSQLLKVTSTTSCLCSQNLLDVMRAKLRPRCHLEEWQGPAHVSRDPGSGLSLGLLTSEWPWTSLHSTAFLSFIHSTTCSACLARSRLGAGDSRGD